MSCVTYFRKDLSRYHLEGRVPCDTVPQLTFSKFEFMR